MSFSDALTRISTIQQQITALTDGSLLSGTSTSTSGTASTTSSDSSSDSTGSDFANALAQASDSSDTSSSSSGSGSVLSDLLTAASANSSPTSLTGTTAGSLSGGASVTGTTGSSLPASASSLLTSSQQQFASTLVSDTGLNPSVVTSWLLAEESGGAAQSRQSANNNDWLNIGYTDSGTEGSSDSIWSDPVSAANATAGWLKGQDTIPGYGTASSGIQSILSSVGQTPQAQISALQNSGWASSGYPSLDSLYSQVTS